jgi:hypothetical protein
MSYCIPLTNSAALQLRSFHWSRNIAAEIRTRITQHVLSTTAEMAANVLAFASNEWLTKQVVTFMNDTACSSSTS